MSGNEGDGGDLDAVDARTEAIQELREVREFARRKTIGEGRIRDVDRAGVKIRYLRTIVYAANAERQLLSDRDLDEMMNELEDLLND